jgi:hypothetical protein
MKKIRPEMNPDQRRVFLETNCYVKESKEYNRDLSEEEIETERHFYAENGLALENIENEFKTVKDEFARKIKEQETLMSERLTRIRTRQIKIYGTLYGVRNLETQKMEYYDVYGDMISSRPLTPDEQDGHLFNNDGQPSEEFKAVEFKPENTDKYADVQDADFEEVSDDENKSEPENGEDKSEDERKGGKKPRKPKS